ncbi:MAG: hypothetical protein GXP31_01375 [Kiritimatiellaeota bacterium]|nr:hypothetical protein [Kiritimatiellota bacterium]
MNTTRRDSRSRVLGFWGVVLGMCVLAGVCRGAGSAETSEMTLLFEDRFDSPAIRWEPTDPAAWKVVQQNGKSFYSLFRPGKYTPPVRSPRNIALIRDLVVSDFVLDLRARSTKRYYPHRDLCLFFGYQDPLHFYYVHLAERADLHANSIFLVDGKPRVSIAQERTEGTKWGEGWHHVRLVRHVKDGRIRVYFDDMAKPIMTAGTTRFTWGRVGIGSFDDTGDFDDITLRGVRATSATSSGTR